MNNTALDSKAPMAPRYKAYKDSGISWLGEVPKHWECRLLKRLVSLKSGDTINYEKINDNGSFPVYGGNGLRGYTNTLTHDGHYVLIGRQGALCGNINYVKGSFFASEHAIVASPKKSLITTWLGELLRNMNLNQYSISAAQPGLSVDNIERLSIAIPPRLEQRAIAAYLDDKTAKLDKLIANKREQIKQLETLRKVTIHDAVTKGLNPDAPMKDSGIAWLGKVPAHWQIKRISKIAALLQTGPFGSQLHSEEYIDHGIPVINPSHLVGGQIVPDPKVSVDSDVFARLTRHALEVGDIVFARRGEMGRCALVTKKEIGWLCGTGSLLFRPEKSKVVSEYMSTVLASKGIKNTLELTSVGSTMDNLNTDILGSIKVPLPPLGEQLRIDIEVKKKLVCIDQLRSNVTIQQPS